MLLLMESPRTFPKSRAHESPRAPGEHHRGSGPPSFPGNFAHERLSRTPKTNGDSRSQGAFRVATSGRNIRLGIDQGQASSPSVQSFGQEPWPGSNCSPQKPARALNLQTFAAEALSWEQFLPQDTQKPT